ncbi:MAG: hypothetical protein ACRDRH_30160 [Pseudonocardia sp.]
MPSTTLHDPVETVDVMDLDMFALDLTIGIEKINTPFAVTSWSYCTPGCTSDGGGSGCSHCC